KFEHWTEDRISNLIASIPRRCVAVIVSKGMATKY
ncbi:hypothetical protein EAI_16851, partial [Harpegnathos saltator]